MYKMSFPSHFIKHHSLLKCGENVTVVEMFMMVPVMHVCPLLDKVNMRV